jgi:hypothetical protein
VTHEQAKALLPVLTAYSEGKEVQWPLRKRQAIGNAGKLKNGEIVR